MKTLIIAEKPSVARDIVGALPGSFDEHKNFYESDDYVVTFAVGHLLELSDPEDYDPAWKSWKLDNLPIIPEEFKVRPRDKKSATQLNLIHKLLKRKDVDRVVNACDAGREGELIFTHIYETSETDKPVDRLWINSMTKAAIRDGFEGLRPAEQLEPLRDAARSRSEADWLVGMNATRAATTRRGWGARRRLARPGPDPDARDDGQARARDPGVHAGAVLARPRHVRPALQRPLVRGRRDEAEGR